MNLPEEVKKKIEEAAKECGFTYFDGYHKNEEYHFDSGARWMYTLRQEEVDGLKKENEELKIQNRKVETIQSIERELYIDKLQKEIARLKQENTAIEFAEWIDDKLLNGGLNRLEDNEFKWFYNHLPEKTEGEQDWARCTTEELYEEFLTLNHP